MKNEKMLIVFLNFGNDKKYLKKFWLKMII